MVETSVSERVFITLEESLTDRLLSTWEPIGRRIADRILRYFRDDDWDSVNEEIGKIDLTRCLEGNIAYMNYVGSMSFMFGVSRLGEPTQSAFMESGDSIPVLTEAKNQSRMILESASTTAQKVLKNMLLREDRRQRVQKAELIKNFVSSFDDRVLAGGGMPHLAASLHTSRLAQFGYTVEATLIGQTHYIINAILDGRECPVCRTLDKEVFEVHTLQERLIKVFRATTTEELISLSPWPGQSAAELERLGQMSSEEIVNNGYDAPPYHPLCRCFIDHVERPVTQVEEKVTGSLGQVPVRPRIRDYRNLRNRPRTEVDEEAQRIFAVAEKPEVSASLQVTLEGPLTNLSVKDSLAVEYFLEGQAAVENVQLYGGVSNLSKEALDKAIDTHIPGVIMKAPGFIKPSLQQVVGDEGIYELVYRILTPSGTKAAYLPKSQVALGTTDVLLKKNQTFRILSVTMVDDYKLQVLMEAIDVK
ncbi:MAG: hypothetical protein GWN00_01090 [Aliifodinibius sp.]|nr:hypothetical protein [Fodinibius sp.]NIV09926.1 hypothetical protein [Fodinibius sp.]NIY23456.1 hypothetical protein [Fodinibius sp.]